MAKRSGPQKEKPKAIDIVEVRRTRRFIRIHYRQGDEDFRLRSNENPLPEFNHALDALAPLACEIVEAPEGWVTNLKVNGLKLGALRDARTASVIVQKGIGLSGKVLNVTTPPALLSTPQTEGAVTQPLSTVQASLVGEAEEQAKRYVKGERAQGTLDIDEDEEDGDDSESATPEPELPLAAPDMAHNRKRTAGEEVPFPGGSSGKPAKKRRSKVTAAAAG